MYAAFFGLKREPFSIAPDPRYLFMSERHREALAHLMYGLKGNGGFVVLTGEIGAGKTTVCRCCLEQIPKRCNVAYIFNPKLTVLELLDAVCAELRIPVPRRGDVPLTVKDYTDPLNEFLLRTHAVGQNTILIVDEAQNLSADVLEQLRLLTNLETNSRKLLQIVLIGQPELRQMLARPDLEQLAQRVVARYHLGALTEDETAHYIRHRLAVSGFSGTMPFDRAARRRIHQIARGVPRRVNLLCDRAMLGAYSQARHRIGVVMVDQAAREVFDEPLPALPGRTSHHAAAMPAWGYAFMAVAAVATVAVVARDLSGRDDAGAVDASGPSARSAPAAGVPPAVLATPGTAAASAVRNP
jgi:general secretion pathway protein A